MAGELRVYRNVEGDLNGNTVIDIGSAKVPLTPLAISGVELPIKRVVAPLQTLTLWTWAQTPDDYAYCHFETDQPVFLFFKCDIQSTTPGNNFHGPSATGVYWQNKLFQPNFPGSLHSLTVVGNTTPHNVTDNGAAGAGNDYANGKIFQIVAYNPSSTTAANVDLRMIN